MLPQKGWRLGAGDRAWAVAVQACAQHMMGTEALKSPWFPFLPLNTGCHLHSVVVGSWEVRVVKPSPTAPYVTQGSLGSHQVHSQLTSLPRVKADDPGWPQPRGQSWQLFPYQY